MVPGGVEASPPLVDFRAATPRPSGYSLKTLKAIELARTIQREIARVGDYRSRRSLRAAVESPNNSRSAARELRRSLNITVDEQIGSTDARTFYSLVRSRVEERETVVLQSSFDDGAGFCLSSSESFDVITINTFKQNYPRRLFTLAHEIYHCILESSGLSDPDVEENNVEVRCNRFAAEFLAPQAVVERVARPIFGRSADFDIDDLRRFASAMKLSMHASVVRLIAANIYTESALGAWNRFVEENGNPDFTSGRSGGRRVEEWKYKLAKYGFLLPRIFGRALEHREIDPVQIFRSSGIKPKYQREYFANAFSARPEDAEDE
jgi:Zn-dependent peptidase ImmA (M78 family)